MTHRHASPSSKRSRSLESSHPIVDLLMPEQVAAQTDLRVAHPIPVLDLPLADQRSGCRAALNWLDGIVPTACPTGDLCPDGGCRRSPQRAPCLLLLPGDHPDWTPALAWESRPSGIWKRTTPAPRPTRAPLVLEELEG